MSQPSSIQYNGNVAKVNDRGELITAAIDFSEPYYVQTTVDNQAYNLITALAGKRFVVTGILIATNKNIVGTATVEIYGTDSADTVTVQTPVLVLDMLKEDRLYLNLFNVATKPGQYINIKATDSQVDCTIFGYYVDA
ncbi:MAG: hypothetical protein ABFS03_00900 [Chloroflexota bacterium]